MSSGNYYYEILGLPLSATTTEVKKAYHALVRRNHPDLFPDERKRLQELKMVQVNEAYARILAYRTASQAAAYRRGGESIPVKPTGKLRRGVPSRYRVRVLQAGF